MNVTTEQPNLNLQVKTLARLLDALGYPNPDDPDGIWGPIGPVVRGLTWAALNPQPLPPRWAGDLVKRFGPQPDPWKGALIARFEIDRMVSLSRMVEAVGGERGHDGIRRQLAGIIDEWCGTPPKPRWPLPWPFPFRWTDEELHIGPADLVVMGVQFHKAAESVPDSALAQEFSAAANRLTETGLERLDQKANQS